MGGSPSVWRAEELLAPASRAVRRRFPSEISVRASVIYRLPDLLDELLAGAPTGVSKRDSKRSRSSTRQASRLPKELRAFWEQLQERFEAIVQKFSSGQHGQSVATLYWQIHDHLHQKELAEAAHKIGILMDLLHALPSAELGARFRRGRSAGRVAWHQVVREFADENPAASFRDLWMELEKPARNRGIIVELVKNRSPLCDDVAGLKCDDEERPHMHWRRAPDDKTLRTISRRTVENFFSKLRKRGGSGTPADC